MPRRIRTTLTDLEAQLEAIRAQVVRLKEQEKKVEEEPERFAVGTEEAEEPLFASRVAALLRGRVLTLAEIAAGLAPMSAGQVNKGLRKLKRDGRVYNVGTATDPRWTWVLGENATPAEIKALVKQLIKYRPMMHQELCTAVGSHPNRISSALILLQREDTFIVNLGTRRRAKWFIPDDPELLAEQMQETEYVEPEPPKPIRRKGPNIQEP